jgi:putative aldouronate transport system substrate-binding protein
MDPNGNGKADEIPYAGSTNGWRQQAYDFLFNSFIYDNPPNLFNLNGDKLVAAYVQDEWRDGLRYMARLSKEGLLSPMSFTQDQAQLKQMAETPDNVVLGAFPAGSLTAILNPTSPRLLEYVAVPPLKGPKGVAWSTFYPSIPANAFYITKSNKNPEASFRWGDFMFSEEAPYRHRFGVPGRDWEYPKAGEVSMFGDQASIKPILNWGAVQNAHWQETTAGYRPYKITDGQVWDGNPKSNQYILVQASKKYYMNKAPAKVVYPFNMTLDESEEIDEVKNTINTYVKEAVARFITGDMNIETDWENYKRELDKMGFKRYMEISQIAYDRMIKGK